MAASRVHLSEFQDLLSQLRDGNNHSACCRAVSILNAELNAPSKSALSQLRGLKRVAPEVRTVTHNLNDEDSKQLATCLDDLEKECQSTKGMGEVVPVTTNTGDHTGIDMTDLFTLVQLVLKLFQGFRNRNAAERDNTLTRKVEGQKVNEPSPVLPPADGDFDRNPDNQSPKPQGGTLTRKVEGQKVNEPSPVLPPADGDFDRNPDNQSPKPQGGNAAPTVHKENANARNKSTK